MSGFEPLVIDADRPGSGASWGNAGYVAFAPEIVAPVPAPGVVRTSLRWLVQPNSPLRLAPRADAEYLRWLGRFVLSCSSKTAAAGLRATLALNAKTADLFDALERDGLEFEMERPGALVVYRSRHGFESARQELRDYTLSPPDGHVLSREEAVAAEPLLEPNACAGAIRYEAERQVRPDKLLEALAARLKQLGVQIRIQSPCDRVILDGKRVIGLRTNDEIVHARACVLAAGTGISRLAQQVGLRVPIEGGRGYSFDLPRDELPLRAPVYIHDGRLALTPFRDFTRVVGMMELGARDATVRPSAITTMDRVGAASFRTWPTKQTRHAWAGLRPMTPDGLPVIGAVGGVENLYIAGGHGMLGVTLSLRTGKAIADCISGERADPVLRPFTPDRFMRRGRRARRRQASTTATD
jgi:D-amino-acid dehydrogenase